MHELTEKKEHRSQVRPREDRSEIDGNAKHLYTERRSLSTNRLRNFFTERKIPFKSRTHFKNIHGAF